MTHWVYVVELDPAVARNKSFREQNPDCDQADKFFYVGETATDPETPVQRSQGGREALLAHRQEVGAPPPKEDVAAVLESSRR